MLARIQECILYRGFSNGEILDDMTELINLYEADEEALKAREDQFFKSVNGLVELAGMYGFSGNIWHTYLTFLLVNHENAFSMASEIRGAIKGSINELAKNDFQIFKELYDFDITVFDKVFGTVCCRVICDYQTPDENSKLFNTRIRDRICQMSKTLAAATTTEEFMDDMVSFYKDDLSFEEFEIEYKYLKAVIEGGLEKKPDNVLIYATSNRRNLVRERATDKLEIADDNDLHSSDTVQEKLSLVYRFGVRIYFGKPDKKQFQEIVRTLAARYGVTMPEEELLLKANQWEITHGGLTGRAAQQFIDYIVGTEEEKKK